MTQTKSAKHWKKEYPNYIHYKGQNSDIVRSFKDTIPNESHDCYEISGSKCFRKYIGQSSEVSRTRYMNTFWKIDPATETLNISEIRKQNENWKLNNHNERNNTRCFDHPRWHRNRKTIGQQIRRPTTLPHMVFNKRTNGTRQHKNNQHPDWPPKPPHIPKKWAIIPASSHFNSGNRQFDPWVKLSKWLGE